MNELKPMTQEELMSRIRDKSTRLLETYQNELTEKHKDALELIAENIASMAYSDEIKRIAIPFETGMGKTTSIIAALICMQETDLSALICVESLDQQRELYQACKEAGIDESKLGVFHKVADKYQEYPSIGQQNADKYQFLIICHNKIYSDSRKSDDLYGTAPIDWMNSYRGKERNIAFWDERLEVKRCFFVSRGEIRKSLAGWLRLYQEAKNPIFTFQIGEVMANSLKMLADWIGQTDSILGDCDRNSVVDLPSLDISIKDLAYLVNLVSPAIKSRYQNDQIIDLFKCTQVGLFRLIDASGVHLVQYQDQIHKELKRLIILDATIGIRELNKLDKSIQLLDLPVRKSYKNVTINVCDTYSSKYQLVESPKADKVLNAFCKEIEVLLESEIPQDEELLIFTFKDIKEKVSQYFSRTKYGAKVSVVHWGAHKASNRLSAIKYIATLGVLRRGEPDLSINILGAKNSLNAQVSYDELRAVAHSEIADMLIQGFGRGNNRRVKSGGVAGETTIWLYLPTQDFAVIDYLEEGMSGVVVKERLPAKHFLELKERNSKSALISSRIELVLSQVTDQTISIRRLRELCGGELDDKQWLRGRQHFLKHNSEQWVGDRNVFRRLL